VFLMEDFAGRGDGLVRYIQTSTGLLLPDSPGELISVPNTIEEAHWNDITMVALTTSRRTCPEYRGLLLGFKQGGRERYLNVTDTSDIWHVAKVAQLTRGSLDARELRGKPVFTYLDRDDRTYGFSFGKLNVDEAGKYGVVVE